MMMMMMTLYNDYFNIHTGVFQVDMLAANVYIWLILRTDFFNIVTEVIQVNMLIVYMFIFGLHNVLISSTKKQESFK